MGIGREGGSEWIDEDPEQYLTDGFPVMPCREFSGGSREWSMWTGMWGAVPDLWFGDNWK